MYQTIYNLYKNGNLDIKLSYFLSSDQVSIILPKKKDDLISKIRLRSPR